MLVWFVEEEEQQLIQSGVSCHLESFIDEETEKHLTVFDSELGLSEKNVSSSTSSFTP